MRGAGLASISTPEAPIRQPVSRLRFLLQTLLAALGLVAIPRGAAIAAARRRRYMSLKMQGMSMYPTLRNGEMLKVDKTAYNHAKPKRGDIVIFPLPVARPLLPFLVKRVVGLPSEDILVQHGHVYINGNRLSEPYVRNQALYHYPTLHIPAGTYFLLGDNRNNSEDSHLLGPVPFDKIAGKVIRS